MAWPADLWGLVARPPGAAARPPGVRLGRPTQESGWPTTVSGCSTQVQVVRPPTRPPECQNSSLGFWSIFPFFFSSVEWLRMGFRRFKVNKGHLLPHTSHSRPISSKIQPWHHFLHATMARPSSRSPRTQLSPTLQRPRTLHAPYHPSRGRRAPRDSSEGHPGRWD